MPGRKEPFVRGGIYHIFNKTIESKQVFVDSLYNRLFLQLLPFYRSQKHTVSHSVFSRMPVNLQSMYAGLIKQKKYYRINILCYCLMSTHFHLLLREESNGGISKFISDSLNAFTRFYNKKNERKGPIFLPRFQSVGIRSREQLIHISRYIHLNPYSASIIKSIESVFSYPWSSLKDYMKVDPGEIVTTRFILDEFNSDKNKYRKFIIDNADYQRNLEFIKYASMWK